MHVALFAAGSDDVSVRQAACALVPTSTIAPALLIVASALDGTAQAAVWIVALLIDYVGGALRGIEGWRLSPGHFAERHGLIVIIALGESIVAIGVGAAGLALGAGELAAAALGVVVAAALWWVYFDDAPERVEQRLHAGERPRAQRDGARRVQLPAPAARRRDRAAGARGEEDARRRRRAAQARVRGRALRRRRALPRRRRRVPAALPRRGRRAAAARRRRLPGGAAARDRAGRARGARRRGGDLRRARGLRVAAPAV